MTEEREGQGRGGATGDSYSPVLPRRPGSKSPEVVHTAWDENTRIRLPCNSVESEDIGGIGRTLIT